MKTVGFLGFGRMAGALAEGALKAGVLKGTNVFAFSPSLKSGAKLTKFGGRAVKNPAALFDSSDLIFLSVKPQKMFEAVAPLIAGRTPAEIRRKCFVSIAAGISIDRLQKTLGSGVSIVRVMPNTPALLGAGMSGVAKGRFASAAQEHGIKTILSSVGRVVSVPEKAMDAVTAISGSGPAYAFLLAESLIEGARALGLDRKVARELAHQTVFGAGLMLAHRAEEAGELRNQVTSPGGTTAAAIRIFEQHRFQDIVKRAVQAAAKRSKELARG